MVVRDLDPLLRHFENIFVDEAAAGSPLARRLESIVGKEKLRFVNAVPLGTGGELSAREFTRSKHNLFVTNFKGQFFKRCPGARPGLSCCNYFVLNWGLQCDMNCSYCYLQNFINTPVLTLYANLEDAFAELRAMRDLHDLPVRIGTGETVDSLSLDPLTLYSRELIAFFRAYPRWTLEFKTKSDKIEQFLDCEHAGNVLISWSVNPQAIVEKEEHGTASLAARLAAARRGLDHGFKVAFHLDPVIWHPEWRANYGGLVDQIARNFSPGEVPYLSVGALRFQPEQRAMMRERFGMGSLVTRAEVFPGRDGKLRYDAGLRQDMFSFILDRFKAHSAAWRVFMCMETPETWVGTKGVSPFKDAALGELFDRGAERAVRRTPST